MTPELEAYLVQMQATALKLESMLELLNAVICDADLEDLKVILVETGIDMAKKLNKGLDITETRRLAS